MRKKENSYRTIKIIILCVFVMLLSIMTFTTNSNAQTTTTIINGVDGSGKITINELVLDTATAYEYGLASIESVPDNFFDIPSTNIKNTSVIIDLNPSNTKIRDVLRKTNTVYITIRKKANVNEIVLDKESADVTYPLYVGNILNKTVWAREDGSTAGNPYFKVENIYNIHSGRFVFEKVKDQDIIDKYREAKNSGENANKIANLKTTVPEDGWKNLSNNGNTNLEQEIDNGDIPSIGTGLYYLWIEFGEAGSKVISTRTLFDRLEGEVPVITVSLPATKTVEIGKTLKLTPTFNPTNATNKIVTWKSSDESVATIDNAGEITAKKIGSTIITVTTQDGEKTATCTVTVTEVNSNNNNNNNNGVTNGSGNNSTAPGKLPNAGTVSIIILAITIVAIIGTISAIKYNEFKKIK